MKHYVLWGTEKGLPNYMEEVITDKTDMKIIEEAKKWAANNNFDRFRISTYNDQVYEKPDFTQTIKI
jgi:hypothetical protein